MRFERRIGYPYPIRTCEARRSLSNESNYVDENKQPKQRAVREPPLLDRFLEGILLGREIDYLRY